MTNVPLLLLPPSVLQTADASETGSTPNILTTATVDDTATTEAAATSTSSNSPPPLGLVHTTTACGHTFHRECLLTWLANTKHENHSCPTCRFAPLYDAELYKVLWAEHPTNKNASSRGGASEHEESATPVAAVTSNRPEQEPEDVVYRMVRCVGITFLLMIIVMSAFVHGMNSSSLAMAKAAEPTYENVTATTCANNVTLPWEELDDRTVDYCIKNIRYGICTICNVFTPIECWCYCRHEMDVMGVRYRESSQCCHCYEPDVTHS